MKREKLSMKIIMCFTVLGMIMPGLSGAESFVTRSNGKLMVDGKTFRFSGANLDWLVLANDEFAHLGNNLGSATNSYHSSRGMIDDAFATLVKMNGDFMAVPGAGGDWWALYYPGRTTGSLNTEEDMKVRVRMLSDHAAAMKK